MITGVISRDLSGGGASKGRSMRWVGSASDAARFVGPHGDFDAVPGAKLGHETGEMSLDRAEADVELVADLGVGATLGHSDQNFLLAAGQCFDGLSPAASPYGRRRMWRGVGR